MAPFLASSLPAYGWNCFCLQLPPQIYISTIILPIISALLCVLNLLPRISDNYLYGFVSVFSEGPGTAFYFPLSA